MAVAAHARPLGDQTTFQMPVYAVVNLMKMLAVCGGLTLEKKWFDKSVFTLFYAAMCRWRDFCAVPVAPWGGDLSHDRNPRAVVSICAMKRRICGHRGCALRGTMKAAPFRGDTRESRPRRTYRFGR